MELLCNFILTGGETDPSVLNYNYRLIKHSKQIKELMETTFPDGKELDMANDYLYYALGTYSDYILKQAYK